MPVYPIWAEWRSYAPWLILLLAVASSANGLQNGFALDDVHIIATNERLHSLENWQQLFAQTYWPPEHGSSLYRPLTSVAFAIQWAIGNGSPVVFHAVNVSLYCAVCISVLHLARQILDERAAFVGSALFAAHPLHVEAVANVVGQAELWVALIVIGAVSFFLGRRSGSELSLADAAVLCAMYGVALMFKEHAIVLPALLAGAELIIRPGLPKSQRSRIVGLLPLLAGMVAVATAFVLIRASVIGGFAGGSTATVLIGQDYSARFFTMLNVIPEWVRLFVWPAELSADYSPPRIETRTSFDAGMVPGLLVIVATGAIAIRVRRNHAGLAYALAFTALTLLIPSNLVIVTGFVLAERALFLGSLGVTLIAGFVATSLMRSARTPTVRRTLGVATTALVLSGAVLSSARSAVWADNGTLFRQTVKDAPTSYRAHLMLGEYLTDQGPNEEGLRELELAVGLSGKQDSFVRWFAADRFHAAGQLRVAIRYYNQALALNPSDSVARYGASMCLAALGERDAARAMAREGMRLNPSDSRFAGIVNALDSGREAPSQASSSGP